MPFNVRNIAVNIAVIAFFGLSFVCWINGLSPFTTCKRALLGATIAFAAATLAVKILNAIIIDAIIDDKINKTLQEEQTSDDAN